MARPPGVRYGTPNVALIGKWMTLPPDEDGAFRAVNPMKYRKVADYRDGGGAQITGREADDRYTPREALAGVAATVAFAAETERQHVHEDARKETTIGLCCTPEQATAGTTPPGTPVDDLETTVHAADDDGSASR